MKWAARAALLGALMLSATIARADPSIWQRARQPDAALRQALLNRVERILGTVGLPDPDFAAGVVALSQLGTDHWRCTAELSSAARGAPQLEPRMDPRLEYLFGGALLETQGREAEARCILTRALRDAPDSPLAADGWAHLGDAAGKLGDYAAERAADLRALELTWDPDLRANLLVSLAESEMALGDLKRALRDYGAAVSSAQQPDAVSEAYFGLAVALDRSGDLPSGLSAAKQAVAIRLPQAMFTAASVLDLPNVYFNPSYEIHYYKALRAMAEAALAPDITARRDALADAVEEWTAYLVRAEADRSPWAQPARLHKASVERDLAKVDRRGFQSVPLR